MRRLSQLFTGLTDYLTPEWKHLPNEVRGQLVQHTRHIRWWQFVWFPLVPFALIGGWLFAIANLPNNGWAYEVAGSVLLIGCAIYIAAALWYSRYSYMRWLHGELNRLGVRPRRCLRCLYDLRGTPDDAAACPECGHTIAPIAQENETTL